MKSKNKVSLPVNQELLIALGESIRTKRLALNKAQDEVALEAQIHRTYLSDIERGQRNVTCKVLSRLASSLQLPISQLLQRAENGMSKTRRNK